MIINLSANKAISKDLIVCWLVNYKKPEDLIGENELLLLLTKLLVERALDD
jgi:putative transposase